MRRDPGEPLPGAPEPWAETDMPPLRDGPPYHMTEMIEAEPALSVRILERVARDGSARRLAAEVLEHAQAGRPILVVGCGTSEHGAQAVAELLGEVLGLAGSRTGPGEPAEPVALQAFEASQLPSFAAHRALVIAVSHEGATRATMYALVAAGARGARTAVITASRRSPAAIAADIVIETGELDQSWCHTVGYLSPIVAGIEVGREIRALGGPLGGPLGRPPDPTGETPPELDPGDVRSLLERGLSAAAVAGAETIAARLAGKDRIVVVGGGVDRIAARELTLKIEEGAHVPAAMRDVETLLHGHLAGMDASTGLIAIAADAVGGSRPLRLTQLLDAVREIGIQPAAIVATGPTGLYDEAIPAELTPAGRIVIDTARSPGSVAGALLATTIPLQLVTERLARARGVNPDPIRRDDPAYLRAAEAAG